MDETIQLPDGRLLDIYVSGPERGMALVFHHGTPGARRPESPIERAAHARGLRFVCASRPGYGGSSRRLGRSVFDVVSDTEAVLQAIGASHCLIAGHSGGGPHALACAVGLQGVLATLVIAGVAPSGLAGLNFTAGMGEENLAEFANAFAGEQSLRPFLDAQQPGLVTADVQEIVSLLAGLLPEVDRVVMSDEIGTDAVSQFREGLRDGVDGWVDDDLAFTTRWGFSPADVETPVTLWQGEADLMVPFSHGQWLADAIPGAHANLLANEGHLSISVAKADQMIDALLALV